ncbi:uncharacterized protein LOC119373905 [Rhipicephalus sanguineus]|uniref:uncharacterized protein LOC119373905 n=1 Tax=Rhipicephalus sanguineus TaxID=34632 RepID=UPI001892E9CA|nr:uncharacterized protein LOC119373905 [Rhipicephalus sanguineus]
MRPTMTATHIALVLLLLACFGLSANEENGGNIEARRGDTFASGNPGEKETDHVTTASKTNPTNEGEATSNVGANDTSEDVCEVDESSSGANLCCHDVECKTGRYACANYDDGQEFVCLIKKEGFLRKQRKEWKKQCPKPNTFRCAYVDQDVRQDYMCNCTKPIPPTQAKLGRNE